jgi:site-specific recombinase XerD
MQNVRLVQPFDPLRAAIDDYLLALESEGRAPKTLAIYGYALKRLASFAGPLDPAALSPALLRRWLKHMTDDGLAAASQADYLRAVKSWIRWLAAEDGYGLSDRDATLCCDRVKPPPQLEEQPDPFTDAEVARLYKACNTTGWLGLRSRAILSVLLDTGIRASEFCGLRIADVDLMNGEIVVRPQTSKTRRGRTIALGRYAKRDAGQWWARKRSQWEPRPEAPFFCGRDEQPFHPRSLHPLLLRLGARAGVPDTHPHRFRHTAAINALKAGMTPFAVMTMLGHSDLTMTRRYIKLLDSDVSQEKGGKSPLDRFHGRW